MTTTQTTITNTAENSSGTKAKAPIKTFRDLGTWQAACELALAVCRQCKGFPMHEQALTGQMTDTAIGICSNIAEAFVRRDVTEKDCFYESAQGLLTKLENQLLVAHGLGYLNTAQHEDLARRCTNTHWILVKLQKINQQWARNQA